MAILLEEKEIKIEWADIQGRVKKKKVQNTFDRAPGVHLSGIIRQVLIDSGMLKPIDEEDVDEMPLRMAVGMAWEDWAVGLWPDLIWQPGEMSKDGIGMNPDGLTLAYKWPNGIIRPAQLEEFKATWCSRRTYGADITQNKSWMWQISGYCHTLNVTRARIHVLWVCGDYKLGPPAPMYVTYLLEMKKQELEQFWRNVVLKNKDLAKKETVR